MVVTGKHIRFVATLMLVALIAAPVVAGDSMWVAFGTAEGSSQPAPVAIHQDRSDIAGLEFEAVVPGIRLVRRVEEGREFTALEIPGTGRLGTPGEPALPAWRRFVEVPEGATLKPVVTVLETEKVDLAALGLPPTVYPAQMGRPKCSGPGVPEWRFRFKESAYHGMVEAPILDFDGPHTFRDHRVYRITLAPVRYDADSGVLEVATRIRVRLEFPGGNSRATAERKNRLASRVFDSFLHGAVLNLNFGGTKDAGWHYPTDAPVEFLIVTPPQFVADLQPFVDWKTSCGYHVTVATTDETGTTTDSIKNYITNLYNGPNPPVYVLMIGDSPTPLVTYVDTGHSYNGADATAGGSDIEFVQMDADLYPDMIIGRWPIDDSTELAAMRDKILTYENPSPSDSGWLDRSLFMEGDDYQANGVTTHETVINQLMGPGTENDGQTILWHENENHTVADLNTEMTTGVGFAIYSAHSGPSGWSGPPPYSSDDTENMTNAGRYPLGAGHSCQSNQWAKYDDVFGETTVIYPDRGLVSYWGASQYTYWDGDDWLERGFFDSLFEADIDNSVIPDLEGQYAQGAACYAGLTSVSLGSSDSEDYYWHEYNLNGDPTLDPFTHAPDGMTVTVPGAVAPAGQNLTVTVSDTVRGAVAGALVAASQEVSGHPVLLGAGYTDASGTATFHIDAPAAGQDLLIRVTAHNHLPADQTVTVAAGSDGVVLLDAEQYRCDSTVGIQLFDDDLTGNGTQDVTLSATPSGASVTVTLTEVTGGQVVKYVGSAVLGTDLVVADGDTLVVTYVDADDGNGGTDVAKTDTASVDCAGPVISNVTAVGTEDTVTITFTTDEPGTTRVIWGTVRPPATVEEDGALVTSHTVTLTGLTPCTRYWFEVLSADGLGNESEDDNGGAFYYGDTQGWSVMLDEPLDADPGWTIDNGGNANGWAFGQPQGQGGDHGQPDPASGYTGDNVYGVNLAGDYDPSLSTDQLKLETPVVDCTELTSVKLSYWRWLGVESPSYDHARLQLSVDGGAWSTVWENTATMDGGSWEQHEVDVTSQAAGHSAVRFRWTLGPTDSSWQFCGWNIDDVRIEGAAPCQICADAPEWPSGSDGVDSVAEVNTGGSCGLTGVDIDWSEATSDCASEVRYRVWVVKGTVVDFTQPPAFDGVDGTHLRVMGLSAEQYAVAVRATDEYGNEDTNTHVLTVTTTGAVSGDVNGDDAVDHVDIDTLLSYFFGSSVPSGSVDVDCSGTSDASDLAREVQYQSNGLY